MTRHETSIMRWRLTALALVATISICSFVRTVSGINWIVPVLGAAWLGQSVTHSLRRVKLWPVTAFSASAATGIWFISLVLFPETTTYGLPTLKSFGVLHGAISSALTRIPQVSAPIAPDAGYLSLLIVGAWLTASLSAALIRRDTAQAALLPWLGFFATGAAVGAPVLRRFFVVSFIGSSLIFLLVDSWAGSFRESIWYGAFGPLASRRKIHPKLKTAFRLGAVSILGAITLPSVLPGYGAAPILDWASGGLPGSRVEISPFVQIRPRLSQSVERVMFTVEADRPAYWRLASLNQFDGETWQLKGNFKSSSGSVRLKHAPTSTESLQQRYEIRALGGAWVPGAYAPTRVRGIRILVDPDRDILLTRSLRDGQAFEVASEVPKTDFRSLQAAEATGVGNEFLALPDTLDPIIHEIALAVSAQAHSPYEKGLAIQNYLRSFEYNENVPPGHSGDYMVRFLTSIQAGYCEQFAGSMAVMLRTLGIPARVAVGFIPGTPSGDQFVVTNKDAHAWVEVYFDGIGWVAFEPTPRTGVIQPPEGETSSTATSSTAASTATSEGNPQRIPEDQIDPPSNPGASTARPSTIDIAKRASMRVLVASLLLMAFFALGRQLVIRLPYALARTSSARVEALFSEFVTRAEDVTRPRERSETEMEFVREVATLLTLPRTQTDSLVGAYQKARYSASGPRPDEAEAARRAGIKLRRATWRRAGWWGLVRMAFSPRPIWGWAQLAVRARFSINESSAARNA